MPSALAQMSDRAECGKIVQSILAKGASLPWAENDTIVMKRNILQMQTIERQLKKLSIVSKIDSYYLSQVRVRVMVNEGQAEKNSI